jgi:succinate dehydrogenase / fumarate reductase cytochrome b subunit
MIWSSVGRKLINAATGLALCGFIIVHLSGNIALLTGARETFNKYSHFLLHDLGKFIYIAEAGLVLIFLLHIISAVSVWWSKQIARPESYKKSGNAGQPSKKTFSSETMIYSGSIILIFTVIHILTFKYGPGIEQGYIMNVDGKVIRDLYQLGIDIFNKPGYFIWYIFSMFVLFLHLRHGFWSAFQSLGANHPRYMPAISRIGVLFAIVMGFGFLVIPVIIFIRGGAA